MTKSQLLKDQSRAINDALSLAPKAIRSDAKPAVEHAFVRGIELAVTRFGESREDSACSYCKNFLSRVIKPLQIED